VKRSEKIKCRTKNCVIDTANAKKEEKRKNGKECKKKTEKNARKNGKKERKTTQVTSTHQREVGQHH
jgi:hypothetical protein